MKTAAASTEQKNLVAFLTAQRDANHTPQTSIKLLRKHV
jgi:hypothetical protein